jgi:hypothetical protein
MKTFRLRQRIRVLDSVSSTEAPDLLVGRTGRVVRCRHCDNGAWVAMDEPLPDSLRLFPVGDDGGREDHCVLYPEDCEEVKE